uniref:Antifreeze glycopeptide polyprotein n=1 Tax=Caulobacter sp. (strain K31) TaxID=366602 RepID=B0T8F5_CAUSK
MVPSKRLAPSRRLTGGSALVLAVLLSSTVSGAAFAQVQVQSLAPPDLFSTPAGETGLTGDLWKDASPGIARDVLPRLAAKPLSPASAALARRVLATGANAPAGIGDDPDLGAARAMALIALGDAKGADTVLDRVPGVASSSALSQAAAEAALIIGADDKACRIGEALSVERGAAYWLRLRAFCQVLGGQRDAAQLTLSLALQQAKDPDYARLMGAVISGTPAGAANLRNGINYALSRKLGLDPRAAAATASPALKPVLKPTGDVAVLAGGADLTAAQASDLAFLRQAKGLAAFTDAAQASLPSIAALARADAPLEDPVLLARAALAAGDLATARTIRGRLTGDTIPGATSTDMSLLDAALAAADGRKDSQILDGLIERGAQAGPKSPAQPAALILAALGGAMSPEARAQFASLDPGKSIASAARLTALDDAAAAHRQGEAALLALSVCAEAGTAGPGPVDRARLVRALLRAGLETDARALAVEGLLALQVK